MHIDPDRYVSPSPAMDVQKRGCGGKRKGEEKMQMQLIKRMGRAEC